MTLSQKDYEVLFPKLGLTQAGKAYIDELRSSEPSRRVQSNGVANCCYRYVSRRMGCALMAESHLEYHFLLRCEFDFERVLEYWEQPPPLGIEGIDRRGRHFRTAYTADVVTISPSAVRVYEVKYIEKCLELNSERPQDWLRNGSTFEYRPARVAFRRLGIEHHVITEQDLGAIESANFELLLQARFAENVCDESKLAAKVEAILEKEKSLSIQSLFERLQLSDVEPLLRMIDAGHLKAKLDLLPLSEIDDVLVALDEETLNGAWEAKSIITPTIPIDTQVAHAEFARSRDNLVMLNRLKQLQGTAPVTASRRTLRRWRALLKSTEDPAALIPLSLKQGNRGLRISFAHEALLNDVLKRFYLTADNWGPFRCYAAYVQELANKKDGSMSADNTDTPISLTSFLLRIRRLNCQESALARGGRRAANAAAAPVDRRKCVLLASRPFQRAHIDHARLKVHLVVHESGGHVYSKRPWLTILVDEYSGTILAMSLAFRAPSRRACALILRDCARRHKRLPETVVADNAKEFESTYFEACLARLGIHKQSKPPAHPRFGTTVERVFGVLSSELVLTLPGNTSNITADRGKSSSHKGTNRASLTLLDLQQRLSNYFFVVYNQHASGNCEMPPSSLLMEGLRLYPSSGKQIAPDRAFLVTTAIECRDPLKVDPQRGIRHNGRYYYHVKLGSVALESRLEVREEPWDADCLYAFVGDTWIACYHGPYPGDQRLAEDKICESTLWLDCASVRKSARLERAITVHEENTARSNIEEKIKHSNTRKGYRSSSPTAVLPPIAKDIRPLKAQHWDEQ